MPKDDDFDVSSVGKLLHCWKHGQVAAIHLPWPSVLCHVTGMNLCVYMNSLC